MDCNIGGVDRIIRAIVGLAIIGFGIFHHSWWGLLGVMLIITAITGICGLYYPFKLNTCKVHSKK